MSHSATSIADSASVKMPEPQESPAAAPQLAHDRLDAQRVLADDQRAEFIDRAAQRAGHRAAVERQADALDAAVGLDAQDDDGAQPSGLFRHVGERIVFRDAQDGGLGPGDLHGALLRVLSRSIAAGRT